MESRTVYHAQARHTIPSTGSRAAGTCWRCGAGAPRHRSSCLVPTSSSGCAGARSANTDAIESTASANDTPQGRRGRGHASCLVRLGSRLPLRRPALHASHSHPRGPSPQTVPAAAITSERPPSAQELRSNCLTLARLSPRHQLDARAPAEGTLEPVRGVLDRHSPRPYDHQLFEARPSRSPCPESIEEPKKTHSRRILTGRSPRRRE